MNKKTNFFIALLLTVLLIGQTANAQLASVSAMVTGSTEDAGKLFNAYLKPYANAFGSDLNAAWYNTAKPHKLLGFDLTFTMSASFVPSSDKSFNVKDLNLTGKSDNGGLAPTIAGEKTDGPQITYNDKTSGLTLAKFNTPRGTGFGIIPAPMMQFAIGVPLETEIIARFIPSTDLGDNGSIQLIGFGLKHSIKQWIPAIKLAPFFNLSVVGGFTQLKTTVDLDFQPSALSSYATDESGKTLTNQNLQVVVKGFTCALVASFDLPVITFYGGLGICTSNTKLKLNGDYPVPEFDATSNKVVIKPTSFKTNPLDISMKSSDGSTVKPRLNAGVKLKLGLITIHVDYTKANYSVITTGLGVSFR